MRLAFAVAAHLEPEILIVNEVLPVGDMEFQKSAWVKWGRWPRVGGQCYSSATICTPSNRSVHKEYCCKLGGSSLIDLPWRACPSICKYLDQASAGTGRPLVALPVTRAGSGEWRFTEVAATKSIFDPAEPKEFTFQISATRPGAGPIYLSGSIVDEEGTTLIQLDSRLTGFLPPSPQPIGGRLRIAGPWLKPGRYTLDLFTCKLSEIVDCYERSAEFEVSPMLPYPPNGLT